MYIYARVTRGVNLLLSHDSILILGVTIRFKNQFKMIPDSKSILDWVLRYSFQDYDYDYVVFIFEKVISSEQ